MATSTVTPKSQALSTGITNNGGAANTWTAVTDASNSTYISANAAGNKIRFGFNPPGITLAADQRVRAIQYKYTYEADPTDGGRREGISFQIIDPTGKILSADGKKVLFSGIIYGAKGAVSTTSTTFKALVGVWHVDPLIGELITQAVLNRMQVEIHMVGSTTPKYVRLSEFALNVDVRTLGALSGITTTGFTTTIFPNIAWTFTPNADNDLQKYYEVKVFDAATYGASNFNPNTSAPVWTSGVTAGPQENVDVTSPLVNGTTYKSYVRVAQDFNGTKWWTPWANDTAWTVALPSPTMPTLIVTPDSTVPNLRALLQIIAHLNELNTNQGSLETDTSGWVAGSFTTISRVTTQHLQGAAALQLQNTSGVSNTIFANTSTGLSGVPITGGKLVTAIANFKAAATARPCRVRIAFYNSAGTFISGGDIISADVQDSTSGWTQVVTTGLSPVGAAFMAVEVQAGTTTLTVANEIHYVDAIAITVGPWNFLIGDNWNFEVTKGTWAGEANTSTAQTTAQARYGTGSMSLTSGAAGDMTARHVSAPGTNGIPVSPGQTYMAYMSFRAQASPRSCRAVIQWYDASGSSLTPSNGAFVTDATASWTDALVIGTAPANAAFATIKAFVQGTTVGNEVHYLDGAIFGFANVTVWTPGGYFGDGAGFDFQSIEYTDVATSPLNLCRPQLADSASETGGTEGFYPRTADFVTADITQSIEGNKSIRWDPLVGAFGFLDIGADDVTWPDGFDPPYAPGIVPGRSYVFSIYVKSTVNFNSKVFFTPIDQFGNAVGPGANSGAIVINSTWTRYGVLLVAPPGAVRARFGLENSSGATGLSIWIDGCQLEEAPNVFAILPLQPGYGIAADWQAVRGADLVEARRSDQGLEIFDASIPPGYARIYRARNYVDQFGGITGPNSLYTSVQLTVPGQWVLRNPLKSGSGMVLFVTDLQEKKHRESGTYYPLGRDTPVAVFDSVTGQDGTLSVLTRGEPEWQRLLSMLDAQTPLQLIYPEGGARFIIIPDDPSWNRAGTIGNIQRILTIPYLESGPPP